MRILAICLFLCLSLCAGAQTDNKTTQLAKSDSLFAKGVELYKSGKFKAAIPFFTESDKIDKAVLDSASNRRDYSSMWLASCYYKMGDTLKAKESSADYYMLEPIDRRLTIKSDSLSAIGVRYYQKGDYKQALSYFQQCGEIEKKIPAKKQLWWYTNTLSGCATLYDNLKDSVNALNYYNEAYKIDSMVYGENSNACVNQLENIGSIYYKYNFSNHLDKSLFYYSGAYHIAEYLKNDKTEKTISYYIAIVNNKIGLSESGEKERLYYKKALQYLSIADTTDSAVLNFKKTVQSNIANSFHNEASLQYQNSNYQDAINLETKALTIYENVFSKMHSVYATALNNLALYNSYIKNYQEAIRLGTVALGIQKNLLGKEHSDYVLSLSNLASYNSDLGNNQEAIRLETEALNINEKILGKTHPDYATSLSNLAEYYSELGNYQEAIRLVSKALNIWIKVYGKEDPHYATSLNNLANYNSFLGNYQEAIRLGTEALKIRNKILGKENSDYATSLNNLANYNSSIGNYQKAISLDTEALNIREKIFGKNSPEYANSLNNLANDYSSINDYHNAILFETEVLSILDKYHPNYSGVLNNLADFNANLGNYQEAIRIGTEALNIQENVIGKEHPHYATSLNNLANYNSSIGNFRESIRLGTEALNIQEKVLGKGHPDYTLSLNNLSLFYFKNKNYNQAFPLLVSYMCITTDMIRTNFRWLTESERAMYWDKYKNDYLNLIPQCDYTVRTDTAYTKMDYNAQLLAKGLLLNSEIDFRSLIQRQGNKEIIAKYEEWRGLKVQINKLYEKTDSATIAYRKTREVKADSLERILLNESKTFGDYTHNLSISWQDVQAKLGPKDAAIEYTSFITGKDSTMYCALLLRKGMVSPKLVPLFEKRELDGLYIDHDYKFSDVITYDSKDSHEQIYTSKPLGRLVWGKVLPYLEGVENVYFSPSGVFHQLGIENLPLADGRPFSEHYEAYRLSSTRELATITTATPSNKADLYGGLQYNEEPQSMEEMSHRQRRDVQLSDNLSLAYGDSLSMYQRAKAFYGARKDSSQSSRAALEVNELPFTREEVMDIDSKLSKSDNAKKSIYTTVYTGAQGNEESFKALSGTHPRIIHIATHGFFLPQNQADEYNDKRTFLMGFKEQQQRAEVDFSLSRAGLLMAGARKAWMGETIPDSIDDGILTAREIAHLDLRGTDLVVLSACETGLGDVTGEGVFGLQRGFKKAGVNTLVMSLWKVDDKATQMMMTQFYTNLMKGQAKRTAFLNAQKYLKDYSIQEKYDGRITPETTQGKKEELQAQQGEMEIIHPYASPQYWAAFIMLDGIK